MDYDLYDFTESVQRSKIEESDIKHVKAAWGGSPEGGGSWTGGFLLALKDGRWLYLSGWCDYTGWGCQDGIEEKYFDTEPTLESLAKDKAESWGTPPSDWDIDPADLNNQIAGNVKHTAA